MSLIGSDSEAMLAELIERKNPSALEAIYRAYAGYLTGVCTRYISDPAAAKDTLHDSFIKIFNSLSGFKYRGAGSLKAWLTRIVVNESLKSLRASAVIFPLDSEIEETGDSGEEPSVDTVPPEVLHRLIRELPDGYRTVLNLYVFENKSHKEIGRLLDIKEATSASQFHRAKSMLARKILEYQKAFE